MTHPRALGVVRDLLQTEDIVLLASAVFTKYAPEQVTCTLYACASVHMYTVLYCTPAHLSR